MAGEGDPLRHLLSTLARKLFIRAGLRKRSAKLPGEGEDDYDDDALATSARRVKEKTERSADSSSLDRNWFTMTMERRASCGVVVGIQYMGRLCASNAWQAEYLQEFPVCVSIGRFVRILVSCLFSLEEPRRTGSFLPGEGEHGFGEMRDACNSDSATGFVPYGPC